MGLWWSTKRWRPLGQPITAELVRHKSSRGTGFGSSHPDGALPLTFDVSRLSFTSTFDGSAAFHAERVNRSAAGHTRPAHPEDPQAWGPAHGYAIARWIEQLTGHVLQIGEGSLYPSLHRLEERGWVSSDWQLSENNRRTKVYTLTAVGRLRLRAEQKEWGKFVAAVSKVLDAAALPA